MNQKIIGKVKDAKILVAHRNRGTKRKSGLDGLVIEFETETNITNNTVIELIHDGGRNPFNVREVAILGDNLIGKAEECGYWADKLVKQDNLDLRSLIGCDIELVEDNDRLKQIRIQSCWC